LIQSHKPSYDAIFLLPSLILGANYLAEKKSDDLTTTVGTLITLMQGQKSTVPSLPQSFAVEDLATLVLLSISDMERIPAGRYLAATPEREWSVAKDVVKEKFRKELEAGIISLDGEQGGSGFKMNCKPTEELFGFKFKSFEEQIEGSLRHYFTLEE
jgi:hypothetical protein